MYHLSASQPRITCPDHMYHLSGSHYVSLVQITLHITCPDHIMSHLTRSQSCIICPNHITYHLSRLHYISLVQINLTNHLSRSISHITCPDQSHKSLDLHINCLDQSHISLVQINLTNRLTRSH